MIIFLGTVAKKAAKSAHGIVHYKVSKVGRCLGVVARKVKRQSGRDSMSIGLV